MSSWKNAMFNFIKFLHVQMLFVFTSIPSFVNNNSTIFVLPLSAAKFKAAQFNQQIKFLKN